MTTATKQTELIVKHTRIEHREGRNGRIYSRQITTWDIVTDDGLAGEYSTKREAKQALWKRYCR